jgi:hypothetical protein
MPKVYYHQQPAINSYPESNESSPYPHQISARSIIILSSHLGTPNGLVPPGSLTKMLYAFLLSPKKVAFMNRSTFFKPYCTNGGKLFTRMGVYTTGSTEHSSF